MSTPTTTKTADAAVTVGALGVTDPNPIENPVIMPDMATFLTRKREAKPTEAKVEPDPKAKVEPDPKAKVEPDPKEPKQASIDPEDGILDPLLQGEEEGPAVELDPKAAKVTPKEDPKGAKVDEAEINLPDGELTGKDAEKAVRKAFVYTRKKYQSKIAELEAQLKSKTDAVVPEEVTKKLTKLETENAEYQKRLEMQEKFVQIANIEMSETFQKQVKGPRESIKSDIIRISKENGGPEAGVSANEIYRAIQLGDRAKLGEIAGRVSELDRVELLGLAKEMKAITTVEKTLRDNAKVAGEEFEAAANANMQKQAAAVKQIYDKSLLDNFQLIQDKNPKLFDKVEGQDNWNNEVDESLALVSRMSKLHPQQVRPNDLAALISLSAATPLLKMKLERALSEVKRLSTRLKGKYATQPAVGGKGGKPAEVQVVDDNDTPPASPEEYFARRAKYLGR